MDRNTLLRIHDRTTAKIIRQQLNLQVTLDEIEWLTAKNQDGKNTAAIKYLTVKRDRQNNALKASQEYAAAIAAELKATKK